MAAAPGGTVRANPERVRLSVRESRRFLPRSAVARIFGVSVSTVTRWAQRGLLPAVKTPGGHYRFLVPEVKRVAEEAGLTNLGDLVK